ncbi:uncharacterized protein MELLADRAFT_91360 [Melampsora larici-populina 98AG31]|uniref:Tet-like 2OG-Fe(II) oxygenase domain-containing protein n=1 Tax=Melampsora larici-populina (strain 98AG31 / pathotype 3-4-7) TaxID=747676 RepID=F4RYS8_MELLP|nr:uncharacterized protein MELLADRAFT_91360 [Melampsora larici-populina 98AG31]EGG02523.1 hypothetical protein MELLADRAFT_91360 [Melampsora larici-populina 98AG31]
MASSLWVCKQHLRVTYYTVDVKLYCLVQRDGDEPVLPGVTFLSDLLKVIDSKRQTGYTDADPFAMPKSYAHVPQEYIAADGFPKSDCWLASACKFAVLSKDNSNEGKGAVVRRALDWYREQKLEGVPSNPPLHLVKTRRKPGTRHAKRARKNLDSKATDQSPHSANRTNKTYDGQRYRLNEPVLPYEDYDRTMEIIFNTYKIITHGKGQFVDRDTNELIFTYSFEDLESLTPEELEEHQNDVDTILMSTKLFKRLPTPKRLVPPTYISISHMLNNWLVSDSQPQQLSKTKCPDLTPPSSPLTSLPPSDAESDDEVDHISTSPIVVTGPSSLHHDRSSSPLSSLPPLDEEVMSKSGLNQRKVLNFPKGHIPMVTTNNQSNATPSLTSKKRKRSVTTNGALTNNQSNATPSLTSKKHKRSVTTNGTLIHGRMHCFGQTVGYSRDILISPYAPTKGLSESLYKEFLDRLPDFGAQVGGRFKSFCDEGFLVARRQLNQLNAPAMASTSKYQPNGPHDFGANFAFTLGNFYNKPHTDNDKGKVYCLWYPIDSISGQIVTQNEGFKLEGGWFIFPKYRVAINFGGKSAVQISWNGKSTFHHTIPSKESIQFNKHGEKVHYTRLGCSSQITYKIARASVKIGTNEQYNHTSKCERKVRDVDDLLELPDRRWKK